VKFGYDSEIPAKSLSSIRQLSQKYDLEEVKIVLNVVPAPTLSEPTTLRKNDKSV
jgi:hypothetical protein